MIDGPLDHKTPHVHTAAQANSLWMLAQFESKNLAALEKLKNEFGVEVLEFPPDVLAELHRLSDETLNEIAAGDPEFKRIFEAYEKFIRRFYFGSDARIEAELAWRK